MNEWKNEGVVKNKQNTAKQNYENYNACWLWYNKVSYIEIRLVKTFEGAIYVLSDKRTQDDQFNTLQWGKVCIPMYMIIESAQQQIFTSTSM